MAGTPDKNSTPHCACECSRRAPQLLTVPEAGARLRVSKSEIYRITGACRIETVRWDGTIRVTEDAVAAWIKAATVPGQQ